MSTQAQPAPLAQIEGTELRHRRFAILSDDLALKILTATATTVVLGQLGFDPTVALIGAALSPMLAELIKAGVERRGLRRRHLLLGSLILLLVHGVERALAALRRRETKPRRGQGPPHVPITRRALLVTGALASAVTVAGFTFVEAVRGNSLVANRPLTFLSVKRSPPPDLVAPVLKLPTNIVVESRAPRRVSFVVSAVDQHDGAIEPTCAPQPGTGFQIGKTRVLCEAVDEAGNRKSGAFTVTVLQLVAEISMRFPELVEVEAAGPSGAVAAFVATATDSEGNGVRPACWPPSGSLFRIGRTTVVCTARVGAHTATRRFPVVVADTTPPRLSLPKEVQAETALKSRVVEYRASASDRVDGNVVPDCSPSSGSRFSLGATNVQCSAVDTHGNEAHGRFVVTVRHSDDTTPPKLALPDDPVAEATSPAGAVVTYEVGAEDNSDDEPSIACSPRSGAFFPRGRRKVQCTAVDAVGNRDTGSFTVTVSDTRAPKIADPGNMKEEAVGPKGAPVSYVASAHDVVDGTIVPSCVPRSGHVFPLGVTEVRCTAQDQAGNEAAAAFEITVTDTTAPVIEVPNSTPTEARSQAGARVTYLVRAWDAVDGAVDPACSPRSGTMFRLGDTVVMCRAGDGRGNSSEKSFTVTVADTTGPKVFPPADVTKEATSRAGARAGYGVAKAVDAVDGAVRASCSPPPRSMFPLGETEVTCSATDRRGNTGTATFRVTVRDTTAPTLRLSNRTYHIDSGSGKTVRFRPARDAVDGFVKPKCQPPSGSFFAVNTTTTVECSARDRSGNVSPTVRFTVTVLFDSDVE